MKNETLVEYNSVIATCQALFKKKMQDYGASWRILRPFSITDQIWIKAQRIKNIEETGTQRVADSVEEDFMGIVNYCIFAIIQSSLNPLTGEEDLTKQDYKQLECLYCDVVEDTKALLEQKNHDYDEAWRAMRLPSITDIIRMKLLRIKQIERQQGKTLLSEGVVANYQDIINYAVFALLKMREEATNTH